MKPEDILYEMVVEEAGEVPLEAIAEYLQVAIVYEKQTSCAASLVGVGDRAVISVDRSAHKTRQRFSIGHELGHWIHDRGKQVHLCKESDLLSRWKSKSIENRANQFASDLLMPPQFFRPLAGNQPVLFSSVRDLASLFLTSLTSTAIKFVESSSYACMLCSVTDGESIWSVPSPFFPEGLEPRRNVGRNALMIKTPDSIKTGEGYVPLGSWFAHPKLNSGRIYENFARVPQSRSTLCLLWWRERGRMIDSDDEEQWYEDDD